jgi:hypothetical protein
MHRITHPSPEGGEKALRYGRGEWAELGGMPRFCEIFRQLAPPMETTKNRGAAAGTLPGVGTHRGEGLGALFRTGRGACGPSPPEPWGKAHTQLAITPDTDAATQTCDTPDKDVGGTAPTPSRPVEVTSFVDPPSCRPSYPHPPRGRHI